MARGEGKVVSKAEPAADVAPPIGRTITRLLGLVGGLRGPGYRLRLAASLVLTLGAKVLAVVSPLVLADGINALSRGNAAGRSRAIWRGVPRAAAWLRTSSPSN